MSDEQTPKGVIEIDDLDSFELTDEQLQEVSAGELVPGTLRYICDKCGTEANFLGVNHQYICLYECPNCGAVYGIW